MSKFFKLSLTNLTASCGIALTLTCGAGGAISSCNAQGPRPTPTPAVQTKKAYVRFWNMLPSKPTNNLLLFAGEKDSVAGVAPNNIYTDYVPVPVGSYTLVVKRAAEGSPVVQRLPAVLSADGYITVLVTEKNGQVSAQMFNDSPDPQAPIDSSPRLVVQQFAPGANIKISVPGASGSPVLGYNETATLDGFPAGAEVAINIQATLPTTPPTTKNVTLTGDFSVAHHLTLLLIADNYGRLHPQLYYDGFLHTTSAPVPGATPGATPTPRP